MKKDFLILVGENGFDLISPNGVASFSDSKICRCVYVENSDFLKYIPKVFFKPEKEIFSYKLQFSNLEISIRDLNFLDIIQTFEKVINDRIFTFKTNYIYRINLVDNFKVPSSWDDALVCADEILDDIIIKILSIEENIEIFCNNLSIFKLCIPLFQKKDKYDLEPLLIVPNKIFREIFSIFSVAKFNSFLKRETTVFEKKYFDYLISSSENFHTYLINNCERYANLISYFLSFTNFFDGIYLFGFGLNKDNEKEFWAFCNAVDFYDDLIDCIEKYLLIS